ncbi:hypothetical protein Trydic_g17776 [Trypoxylus dichotomus]
MEKADFRLIVCLYSVPTTKFCFAVCEVPGLFTMASSNPTFYVLPVCACFASPVLPTPFSVRIGEGPWLTHSTSRPRPCCGIKAGERRKRAAKETIGRGRERRRKNPGPRTVE